MKSLIGILKNRNFILGLFLFILVLIIIGAGFLYQWSWERQIFGLLLILFFWVIILMYTRLQAVKSASFIENSIKIQAEQNILAARPDKQEEIGQLKDQLTAAIQALKKSNLGKGISGKSALYALPWYMFIGPPGAGKTTAIENSGLEFPCGSDRIRGVGGTRNCDWFFSSSAILLDTAGRYTTEEEDREEWNSFLEILKKYRKKKPINGVIIGVSIADLFNSNAEDVENSAKVIRTRIDELVQKLGVRFPVYLVFTKCDLIQGFVEFFGDFTRVEREQIWGGTFSAELQNDPDPAGVFKKESHKLYESLILARLKRLNNPMQREEKRKVYTFPLEFNSGNENLSKFIETLFRQNPYQENPYFRGFYFTSGTQEGIPIDRVIQSIAKQFDLPTETIEKFDPEMETKSYFINDLFSNVIIPDQNLVGHTSRMATKRGLMKFGIATAVVALLVALLIGFTSSYIKFKNDANALVGIINKVKSIRWTEESFSNNFYELEQFRQHLEKLGDIPMLGKGIYQGNEMVESANQLYYTKLKPFVDRYLYDEVLTNRLNAYVTNREDMYRDEAYNYLRTYLLMSSEVNKLRDSQSEKIFLNSEVLALVDTMLEDRFNFAYQATQNNNLQLLQATIKKQISYFIEILSSDNQYLSGQVSEISFKTNRLLVNQVRSKLGTPNIFDIYARLKREGLVKGQSISLSQAIGGRHSDLFQSEEEVPGFFTKTGYESFVSTQFEKAIQNPEQDDWVLGAKSEQLPDEMQDQSAMEKQLWLYYYRDYSKAWWNFLKSINVRSFDSFSIASTRLKILGDFADSPLRRLLETVSLNTNFESEINKKAQGLREKLGIERSQHPVDREFFVVHTLNSDEGGNLTNILAQYELIASVLESLDEEPVSGSAEYAALVIGQRTGEFPEAIRVLRKSLRGMDINVQQEIFNQPVMFSWRVILKNTKKHLNKIWEDQVYNNYKMTLAEYYPFNASSRTEAPIADLVSFFQGSSGILWDFVNKDLSPFVREDGWVAKTWEGNGITLSNPAKTGLQKATNLTAGLGLKGGSDLQLVFSILPQMPTPTGVVDQVNLIIDGREIEYRMGRPRWSEYSWPGYQGTAMARLEVNAKQWGYAPLDFTSDWGWFRLLDLANIQKISASNFDLQWKFSAGNAPELVIKFKLRASSINNPFGQKNFFALSFPRTLFQ